jgi:2-oxoglutarate dehydrogenase E1 component
MSTQPRPVPPSVNGWNPEYLDAQYARWLERPDSVAPDLASFFAGFDLAHARARAAPPAAAPGPRAPDAGRHAQAAVSNLIQEYRAVGHLHAWIDPFGRERPRPASLDPATHGLTDADLDRAFDAGSLAPDGAEMTLREIVGTLDRTYCGSVGIEFEHISDREQVDWLISRIEPTRNQADLSRAERAHVLYQLYRAELFEKFCGKRYPGVKRFSLEGGESLIPMLDAFIERAGDAFGVREVVFGMSHRGRLNVLTNIIGKTYEQIFTEFEDAWADDATLGGGDVKYHRGYSANRVLPSGSHVWLAMTSNPSHLESVGPVALGRCRAKQRLKGDTDRSAVVPLLIHGDAAVIAQGVVAELFNMSRLEGYTVGGTVHVVVNNLIGFTTGQDDARSSRYCTDMAKMIEAPVLHVNGEDPDACVHAVRLALDYRMRFKRDVVIDLLCYRRHGHNESDEAAFTQPVLYKQIKSMPSVLTTYTQRLVDDGVLSEQDQEQIRSNLHEELDRAYTSARKTPVDPTPDPGHRLWVGVQNDFTFERVGTGVPREALDEIAAALGRVPEGFTPHRKLAKVLEKRSTSIEQDAPLDWATAEAFAFGSMLIEGVIVRLSGQDSRRGTFSQRHAAITDVKTAERYVPLNHIREVGVPGTDKEAGTVNDEGRLRQAKLCVYDSPLSEFGVLGFEYGFSLASPRILALWEAQFGDFANGAQVIIDQFIASAEAKWRRWSGLTMLLPHGYEGQGPEHSSARIERFLKLCGQYNLQVCYPTTPAQYFHMLRRQTLRRFRKPLVVMTPKSLLRLPACVSSREDLISGAFHEVLDDPAMDSGAQRKKVKRLLLCSGKVYYDLEERRRRIDAKDVAIVRVEQLYPIHTDLLEDIVGKYPGAELVWVQEEPKNCGAWGHMAMSLREIFGWDMSYVGRKFSATPATGSPRKHREELEQILSQAVGPVPDEDERAAGGEGSASGPDDRKEPASPRTQAKAGAA